MQSLFEYDYDFYCFSVHALGEMFMDIMTLFFFFYKKILAKYRNDAMKIEANRKNTVVATMTLVISLKSMTKKVRGHRKILDAMN